jgi:hypothetical protein
MLPSRLEIQRLQRELRGYSVTRAGRSIGSCILLDFTTRSSAKDTSTKPGLLVELAKWEIRSRNIRIAGSCAGRHRPAVGGTQAEGAEAERHHLAPGKGTDAARTSF